MNFIQIDITNACNKACSNCTRFCGNHRKPFFMDYETFCRAVDSLEEFHGVTGIIGGEPTIHPEFERFVGYLKSKYGTRKTRNRMVYPIKDFISEIKWRENESYREKVCEDGCKILKTKGPGLWSNMSEGYRKYYELIQDVFEVQLLNDHINPSYHQPGLFSRKDLGIPDEEWIPMRDKCWIQNNWSATITPKGAFFCEIAGALDMLFDGPGGWEIEPGWWKRKPEEFGDQLHWCEICGFALDTFMRDAEEEIDDVSPTLYEKLKTIDSPRMKAGRTHLVEIENGRIREDSKADGHAFADEGMPYLEHYEDRFNEANSILFDCKYKVVDIAPGDGFGEKLNRELSGHEDWILFLAAREKASDEVDALIRSAVLNPGSMHQGDGWLLFNKNAISLKRIGYDGVAHAGSMDEIIAAWDQDKVIRISDMDEATKVKRKLIGKGKKYAIWGTGISGAYLADIVVNSGGILTLAIDADESKQGTEWKGVKIISPEEMTKRLNDFDKLIVAHLTRYSEIQNAAVEKGLDLDRILLPTRLVNEIE